MDKIADKIRDIIAKNDKIAVLSGSNVARGAGLNGVHAEHLAYDTEEKYGYSNDEIISSAFYSRRAEIFYDYVKNVVLNKENPQPTEVHKSIRQLQQKGKEVEIITRTVYELYEKADCKNVIDMHGSIERNKCQSCGKEFGMEYVKKAKGVPVCDVCQVPIRPGFTLIGEQVDNGKVTDACNAVEDADVLLVIGAAVRDSLCQYLIKYYTGNKFILINTEEKTGDERADYQLYGDLSEIVSYVTDYDPDAVFPEEEEDDEKADLGKKIKEKIAEGADKLAEKADKLAKKADQAMIEKADELVKKADQIVSEKKASYKK